MWMDLYQSVAQLCPTLCDPMDYSTPGFPVHHHLPELGTHVHWVGDAIQPSHPLLSPSPPAFNLSQHQGLFQASKSFPMRQLVLHIRWMDLEIIILSEVSQTERQIYDITYIWNLKYGSNKLISKMETDSQIYLFIFLNFILFLNFT